MQLLVASNSDPGLAVAYLLRLPPGGAMALRASLRARRAHPADATGRTAVPGVWAAGNVTDLAVQFGASAAAGALAAAHINAELIAGVTGRAVEAARRSVGAATSG